MNNIIKAKGLIRNEKNENQSKINFSESIHSFLKNFEVIQTTINKVEVENFRLRFSAESLAHFFIEINAKEKNNQDFNYSFRNSIIQIISNNNLKEFKISALAGKFKYSTKNQTITNGNMQIHSFYD